ncbi:phosphoribosyltransferase [Chryseobacterium koreense]|uniref:phosphoribosyltransferase n=1 Tax=Chryseobacterium koreense TaxID=232216 RepID=UPI0026F28063|nr:phosphoribosyltransferase family protein [Chryseobacterium koreense]
MIFKNRYDAAMHLVPLLRKYKETEGVVLAIPRGAVPMGYYIAQELHLPLDLLMTKKIGHPRNPELAIGSVSLEGRVIDPRFNMDEEFIEQQTTRIREMLKNRYEKFMGKRSAINLEHKTVIIVDDGIATGNTMQVSVDLVRHHHPKKVVIATPVASEEALRKLREKADEVVCLYTPTNFRAVSEFYDDFSAVTDEDVIDYLNRLNTD